MKKILFIIIFHTAVFAINNPFKVGELLKYSAEWNGIKVGNAELFLSGTELFNDVETYQITFTTNPHLLYIDRYLLYSTMYNLRFDHLLCLLS